MVFSSLSFLILFLPPALILYYLTPLKWRNYELFAVSVLFYALGEPVYVFLFLCVILWTWVSGLVIGRATGRLKAFFLILFLAGEIGVLCLFKYGTWISGITPSGTGLAEKLAGLTLPIGISFYCFQSISYTIDVYRGEAVQKNPFFLGLYLAFFPQLIAGPIVRYPQFAPQLTDRKTDFDGFSGGVVRFACGLCKKVLLANTLGGLADHVFGSPELGRMSSVMVWLGAFAYMLQIYFDFSGYSDMAIGLGSMFGFRLPENFDHPYAAGTATEFWRRWHMTLSRWFRDYVYIPLGGNRRGFPRECLNLMIVWGLTGLWHGAGVTFLLWGLFWGVMLILEKAWIRPDTRSRLFRTLYHIPVFLVTLALWVLFRASDLQEALAVLSGMFSFRRSTGRPMELTLWLHDLGPYLAAGIFFMLGGAQYVKKLAEKRCPLSLRKALYVLSLTGLLACTLLAVSSLVNSSYNPFLYFNF